VRYATVMDVRKNAARLWPVIELGRVTDAQCDRPVPSNAAGAESARGRVRDAGAPPGRRLDSRGSPRTPEPRRPGAGEFAPAPSQPVDIWVNAARRLIAGPPRHTPSPAKYYANEDWRL